MSLLELFCAVDDFYQHFQTTVGPKQLARGRGRKRGPAPTLAASEIITLIIHFHQGGYCIGATTFAMRASTSQPSSLNLSLNNRFV